MHNVVRLRIQLECLKHVGELPRVQSGNARKTGGLIIEPMACGAGRGELRAGMRVVGSGRVGDRNKTYSAPKRKQLLHCQATTRDCRSRQEAPPSSSQMNSSTPLIVAST